MCMIRETADQATFRLDVKLVCSLDGQGEDQALHACLLQHSRTQNEPHVCLLTHAATKKEGEARNSNIIDANLKLDVIAIFFDRQTVCVHTPCRNVEQPPCELVIFISSSSELRTLDSSRDLMNSATMARTATWWSAHRGGLVWGLSHSHLMRYQRGFAVRR